jgi:hypothetical protein
VFENALHAGDFARFPCLQQARQAGFAIQLRDGFELATGLSLIFVENLRVGHNAAGL